jgi:hypothetical protein
MKIAILGTRGVPNYYGGFEQFAEFFSVYLVQKGHEVYCYNSHDHPFQEKSFHGLFMITTALWILVKEILILFCN